MLGYLKNSIREKKSPAESRAGDPEEIRTPNLLIRSQMLYPIKLRGLLEWGKYTFIPEFYKKLHENI